MDADLAAEGRDLHLRALETSAGMTSALRPRSERRLPGSMPMSGSSRPRRRWPMMALALARDPGDEWAIAHVLITQSGIAMSQGRPSSRPCAAGGGAGPIPGAGRFLGQLFDADRTRHRGHGFGRL